MKRNIYDNDQEEFRASVKAFLDRYVLPQQESHIAEHGLPRQFWLEAGAQGLLGLEILEEYGGSGAGDYRFTAVLTEELSKVAAAYASCVSIHAEITAPYLVELGTEEQKRRWLPGVASGEVLLAIGMTEPSGGSDLAAMKTTAVRDGAEWVINGSKIFITNGYSADLVIVAARTSPEKELGASRSSPSRQPLQGSVAGANSTKWGRISRIRRSCSSTMSASLMPRSSAKLMADSST